MLKKGVSIFTGLILLILLLAGSIQAETMDIEVKNILFSQNTAYKYPATNLLDGNDNSSWQLETEAESGWVELFLEEKTLIYGLEIDGQLAEEDRVMIEYYQDGHWLPFINTKVTDLSTDIIDLSYDRLVIDRLRLQLKGEQTVDSKINNIRVLGKKAKVKEHNIEIDRITVSPNTTLPLFMVTTSGKKKQ